MFISGLRGSGIRTSLVIGIIIVRFVALPLAGVLIVKGAMKFGLVHSDPLYVFVLLLQYALPPAVNIGIIHTRTYNVQIAFISSCDFSQQHLSIINVMLQQPSLNCSEQERRSVLLSCCGLMFWLL